MKFEDLIFDGLEKEDDDGTRTKNYFDMSSLIGTLRSCYSVQKKSSNYYILINVNNGKKLHLIWRYRNTEQEFWSATKPDINDIPALRTKEQFYILALIRFFEKENMYGCSIHEYKEIFVTHDKIYGTDFGIENEYERLYEKKMDDRTIIKELLNKIVNILK